MQRKNRRCTDFCCLVTFVACVVTMGYLTYYGIAHGQIKKMIAPINANGIFCGIGATEDYPRIYFTAQAKKDADLEAIFNSGVCVKDCPTEKGG